MMLWNIGVFDSFSERHCIVGKKYTATIWIFCGFFRAFSRVLLSLVVNSFRNANFDSIERFWDANLATQSRGICQAVGQIKHVQLFLQKRGKGKDKPHSGTSGQKQSVTQFLTSKGTATHDWVIEGSQFEIWSASFSIRKQKPMMTQFS